MEIREYAERLFLAKSLEDKLFFPERITDRTPFLKTGMPTEPLRPDCLALNRRHKTPPPGLKELDDPNKRGLLLHYFANHELLAIEIMAYALMKFPDAPSTFRRSLIATIRDEQKHLQLYLQRIQEYGVEIGDVPLNTFFWDLLKDIENPKQYMCGMALTLEQANLDFALQYRKAFELLGDKTSADLLQEVYEDEISHVRLGVQFMRRHKEDNESEWQAFVGNLPEKISPIRAKAVDYFDTEGRKKAGMNEDFIQQIRTFTASRGRDPRLFFFNPHAEAHVAAQNNFTPNKSEEAVENDLSPLLALVARRDDIILLPQKPCRQHLLYLNDCGLKLPSFIANKAKNLTKTFFTKNSIKEAVPWAWSPDAYRKLTALPNKAPQNFRLFCKTHSLGLHDRLLEQLPEDFPVEKDTLGQVATDLNECLKSIKHFRSIGFHHILFKCPLGSSGQGTLRLLEEKLQDNQINWLNKRLRQQGQLIVEPLLPRLFDFSIIGKVDQNGVRLKGFTAMHNDLRGQYSGTIAGNFERCIPNELRRFFGQYQLKKSYEKIIKLCGEELKERQFEGIFGVDAFVYKSRQGLPVLKLLCEINPRQTMGSLALEAVQLISPGKCLQLSIQIINESLRQKLITLTSNTSVEQDSKNRLQSGMLCLADPRLTIRNIPLITIGNTPEECQQAMTSLVEDL